MAHNCNVGTASFFIGAILDLQYTTSPKAVSDASEYPWSSIYVALGTKIYLSLLMSFTACRESEKRLQASISLDMSFSSQSIFKSHRSYDSEWVKNARNYRQHMMLGYIWLFLIFTLKPKHSFAGVNKTPSAVVYLLLGKCKPFHHSLQSHNDDYTACVAIYNHTLLFYLIGAATP